MASDDNLQPISPQEAVELYFQHRESELAEKTLINHRYRLDSFVSFCVHHGIENLNELTGRHLHQFRVWRSNGDGDDYEEVKPITLQSTLATLRVFLEFAASIDAVAQGMRERVLIPTVDPDEKSRDERLEPERAQDILEWLERFQYASREHVILALLWHTGIRLGSLRALDVHDSDKSEPCLLIRHRPKSGTPLKNGNGAERDIAVGEHYAQVLEDYIQHHRHDVQDDYGRHPLITSEQGRLTAVPIRRTVYRWTQPCRIGDCPHDKEPDTCEWRNRENMRDCPSSRSPHGVRRGSITKHLVEGVPQEVVSDRMNSSADVLDEHYDQRTKREKMRNRRDFLTDL